MNWTQVDIVGPEAVEEIAIACLVGVGCSGVQVIRQEDLPALEEEGKFCPPRRRMGADGSTPEPVMVRGYLPEGHDPTGRLNEMLADAGPAGSPEDVTISLATVQDEDWSRSWKKYHRPFRVGKRFRVVPSWSRSRGRKDDLILTIDPGMAFGTGQHATTYLCLQALEVYLTPGARVIDVGCGSAILSIAAARLGAEQVLALDTDCVATTTAENNCVVNGVEEIVQVRQATLAPPYPPADLVIANILAPVIIKLIPAARSCLETGHAPGLFISSGILQTQEDDVRRALEGHGMEMVDLLHREEWSCLVARMPGRQG